MNTFGPNHKKTCWYINFQTSQIVGVGFQDLTTDRRYFFFSYNLLLFYTIQTLKFYQNYLYFYTFKFEHFVIGHRISIEL